MMQFPQPTRPINSYDLESLHFSEEPSQSQAQPIDMDNCESCLPAETRHDPIQSHHNSQTSMEGGGGGEKAEELLKLIKELYEKLPESIRNHVNLDKLNGADEKLKGVEVDKTTMRGVNGPMDELQQKLERFKIKTVQLGGVVKQEDDKP
ncbi:hypothetical protein EZV62_016160 [Acer yangbiense]|uniref:Uncharacterized protein n=1 Tax=Acer yangbiense TaxID=1000413 RepID=A0A5C7HMR8_9ROSI|nr:hypothetical protein EZV62_016160 [Acer yangbiense]